MSTQDLTRLLAGSLVSVGAVIGSLELVSAQIVPDDTLGDERSRVTREVIRGIESDRIDGGARRGQNLFHSFEQFDVEAGLGAYFVSPAGVQSIFSRVTGGDRSEIRGTLGVLGDADLFLMNPNGILFGPESRLDLTGSFLVTTAGAIRFGDQGVFSAINPDVPPLLTVNPSVFLFNQITSADITVNAVTGLQVTGDASLTVLGGDIQLADSLVSAVDGRIGIAAVGETRTVSLRPNGRLLISERPALGELDLTNAFVRAASGDIDIQAGELTLSNGAQIFTSTANSADSGDIRVVSIDIQIEGSNPTTGLLSALFSNAEPGSEGNTGNIRVSTNALGLSDGGQISTATFSTGNAGDVRVEGNRLTIKGVANTAAGTFPSRFFSSAEASSEGNTGNIRVESGVLGLSDGGQISTATFSTGNAGDVRVEGDRLSINGLANSPTGAFLSSIVSDTAINAEGSSGDVWVNAERISLFDGGRIESYTRGTGDAGDVRVEGGRLSINGFANTPTGAFLSAIQSSSVGNVEGSTGDIRVNAETVDLVGGGRIETATQGTGDAGDIEVEGGRLSINGFANTPTGAFLSAIRSGTVGNVEGSTGDIRVNADTIDLLAGGRIETSTEGTGDAEDIEVDGDSLSIEGFASANGQIFPSKLNSETVSNTVANSGSLDINVDRIEFTNGGQIANSTNGAGNAGDVEIEAEFIRLQGEVGSPRSSISSSVFQRGSTGAINIRTDHLEVYDGSQVSTLALGAGDPRTIYIDANRIAVQGTNSLNRSEILIQAGLNEDSNAGNLRIFTDDLIVSNGGIIRTFSFNPSDAGNIHINAENIRVDGGEQPSSGIVSEANASFPGLNFSNDAGNIHIKTERLALTNGGTLSTSTFGSGDAGNIVVDANTIHINGFADAGEQAFSSGLFSAASSTPQGETVIFSEGDAGDIRIEANRLELSYGGVLSTSTFGLGDAGSIIVDAGTIHIDGFASMGEQAFSSGLFSTASFTTQGETVVPSRGNAGDIQVEANRLELNDGGLLSTSTFGLGDAGDIIVDADTIRIDGFSEVADRIFSISGLFSSVAAVDASGNAGTIQVEADNLELINGGQLSTSTFGSGNAGDIVTDVYSIRIDGFASSGEQASSSGLVSEASSTLQGETVIPSEGNAGDIRVEANHLELSNGGALSSSTFSLGNAGDIEVDADQILIRGIRDFELETVPFPSSIASVAGNNSQGRAGSIQVQTDRLVLRGGGILSTSTSGLRDAGDIVIDAGRVLVDGFGEGTKNSSLTGILSEAEVPRDGEEVIGASEGNAGTVQIEAERLDLRDGGIISSSTASFGNAGSVIVEADTIRIDGLGEIAPFFSGLFSTAVAGSRGNAGIIRIDAEHLVLTNGGRISTSTEAVGDAGNIDIGADSIVIESTTESETQSSINSTSETTSEGGDAGFIRIEANENLNVTNSSIRTSAIATSGGGIDVTADQILLTGDGDIQTEVSSEDGGAGNIRLTANLIVAFDDSDILAFAEDGTGGNIRFRTPAFFGESFNQASLSANPSDLEGNNQVDINATGAIPGTVNVPDLAFLQNSLINLPQTTIDTETLLSKSCVTRTADGSTFLITGSGGLPDRPSEVLPSHYSIVTIRPAPSNNTSTGSHMWELGDPMVEPQGLYQLPDGRLVLSRECTFED